MDCRSRLGIGRYDPHSDVGLATAHVDQSPHLVGASRHGVPPAALGQIQGQSELGVAGLGDALLASCGRLLPGCAPLGAISSTEAVPANFTLERVTTAFFKAVNGARRKAGAIGTAGVA